MMDKECLRLVIVGHLDHGKSTFIGRLLCDTESLPPDRIEEIRKASFHLSDRTDFAYFLDYLEEERKQAMTIDTTQVFLRTDTRDYVIIDAPGHTEFIRNMITGASQAEAAVLIIDVKAGAGEQTRRHAYILSLLGLKQIIVVLNKMDLIGYQRERFQAVQDEIRSFLRTIEIAALFYIPVSATEGENIIQPSQKMPWYRGPAFMESLNGLESRELPEDKALIFPVQDIYGVNGKRIIAGRVESGVLEKGAKLKILPGGRIATVGSIEQYPAENPARVSAGQCTGINLQEFVSVERGDVLCLPGREPPLGNRFCGNLIWMTPAELSRGESLLMRCATQETSAEIKRIGKRIDSSTLKILEEDADKLKNLEVGEVVIETKKPIVIKPFADVQELGRFVLIKDNAICAGGIFP